ncbi:MAG TPA: GtrA family protein [Dermatophilaceae bacterium]|nr:GtrA family protein [Dermatophilaceae bacterium]
MSPAPTRPGLVARARGAVDVLYREMIKFGVVGAVAFVVDLGSFNVLRRTVMDDRPTTATIVSAMLATVVAWLGNRMWTFRHRRNRPMHHEAALFAATNGVALVIQAGVVATSHYLLGLQSLAADNVAKVVGIGLGTLFRFWAYRTFVFAGEPLGADTSPLGEADEEPAGAGRDAASPPPR